jgi:antitoxin MazE
MFDYLNLMRLLPGLLKNFGVMKTKLVQIGNSKGIRIPKSFIEQYRLEGQVELIPSKSGLLVTASAKPRSGWEDLFKNAKPGGKDVIGLAWRSVGNKFDKEEWTW